MVNFVLDVIGNLGDVISVPVFQDQIFNSKNGFYISWEDLHVLTNKCNQIIDMVAIGCRDENILIRYDEDQASIKSAT